LQGVHIEAVWEQVEKVGSRRSSLQRETRLRTWRISIDGMGCFLLNADMHFDRPAAVQLIAFFAFIAAILTFVLTSLTFISTQCTRGTPFLPAIFPCFQGDQPPG
jgi:hypothetical protein